MLRSRSGSPSKGANHSKWRRKRQGYHRDLAEAILREDVEQGGDGETNRKCKDLMRAASESRGIMLGLSSTVFYPPWWWRAKGKTKRRTIIDLFESIGFQKLVVAGTLLDIVIISIEIQFPDHPFVELLVHLVTRTLLLVFVAELAGLMYGYGASFFKKLWYVIDAFVVTATLLIEWHPWTPFDLPVTLFPLRIWRVLRVIHAFALAIEMERTEATTLTRVVELLSRIKLEKDALLDELQHEKKRVRALERELSRINDETRQRGRPR